MLPEELFASLASKVFVVQALDSQGGVLSFGSGVAVKPDHVVTNKHVVKDAVAIRPKHGHRMWPAKITHLDPNHDMCLLLVEDLGAQPVPLRGYPSLTVGERVYAIGSPEGFDLTLSEGLISGLRRRAATNVIQTTAPISRGSSGGGLFDSEGRLIGITTYFLEEEQSLNFAISADLVMTLEDHPFTEESNLLTGESNLPLEDSESQTSGLEEQARREYGKGKYGAALKLYREAVALRPENENNWLNLGICCYKVSLFEDAIEAFQGALRLKPQLAEAWHWKGLAYGKLKKPDLAIEAFKEAVRLTPNDLYAWLGLGDAYRDKRCRDEAFATYNEAIRLNPQADLPWRHLGILHLDTNHYNAAISAFQEAIRREPDGAYNWYWLGVAYYRQGELEKRFQVMRRLEELDPKLAREFSRTYKPR